MDRRELTMEKGARRLFRLAETLDRLREVHATQLLEISNRRALLIEKHDCLEALLAAESRVHDLAYGGILRRLNDIAAELNQLAAEDTKLRQLSANAFIKAKWTRTRAASRIAEAGRVEARKEITALTDNLAYARLRQGKDR